jgi:formate/nitrite transporter
MNQPAPISHTPGEDPYGPTQIADLVGSLGVRKAGQAWLTTFVLALQAGAYIALGAALYTEVIAGSTLGPGLSRWIGGFAFSLGLVMVLIGGGELFTGNSLMVMAWAERRIALRALAANWALVYLGNLLGAGATVVVMYLAGLPQGSAAEAAAVIAAAKAELPASVAFFRGVLCNVFVCMAVWLSLATRQVAGRILAIMLPVAAFVGLGLEHSIANMYLIPTGQLARGELDLGGFFANLVPVTLGNIVGGGGLVAGVYWLVYLRRRSR